MKKILLFSLISSAINGAASSGTISPTSSATGRIRPCLRTGSSIKALPTPSAPISIPTPKGHMRKRSNSEKIELESDWASPTSASSTPYITSISACSSTPNIWCTSPRDHFLYERPDSRYTFAAHRPARYTQEEEAAMREEKWREMRAAAFGKAHKRRTSLPSPADTGLLHFMMELSHIYGDQKECMQVQDDFNRNTANLSDLFVQLETGKFEEYIGLMEEQQKKLDACAARTETALARAEALAQKLSDALEQLAQQHASLETTSPRQSIEKRRSKSVFSSTLSGMFGGTGD